MRCWGYGGDGELGYGNTNDIGDNETPGSVGPVDLGPGRSAVAISAGYSHTCAILDNGTVRCWGDDLNGELGYGNTATIGDDETPGSVGPVNLGAGRTGAAISAGEAHTCATLDDGTVRCWGAGGLGRLGYGNTNTIGDNETPGSVGPVDLLGLSQRPVFGKRAEASPVSGVVKVKLPGSGRFVILRAGRSIPIGSIIDTRNGRVRILSADGKSGETRVADFFEGLFKLRQGKKTRGYTDAKLVGPLACGKSRSSATASKGRRGRHVWGSGKGRHSSTGKNSSGSVRGTEWLVWDRCDGSTLSLRQERQGPGARLPHRPQGAAAQGSAATSRGPSGGARASAVSRRRLCFVVAVLAAGIGILAYGFGLLRASELDSIDARFSIRGAEEPPSDIVLVLIDARTFDQLDEQWPFPRSMHGRVIDRLRRDGARVVAYDVQFTEPTVPRQDNVLINAVARMGGVTLANDEVNRQGRSNIFGGESVLREIDTHAGNTDFEPDPGATLRKVPLATGRLKSFGIVAAESVTGDRSREQRSAEVTHGSISAAVRRPSRRSPSHG